MPGREEGWTVEEANAALDRVRATVRRIQELAGTRREQPSREMAARIHGNGQRNGQRLGVASRQAAELRAALDELSAEGILLRDVDNGLVDFPARSPSGRPYWLCWLVDEPEVAWWHWPETGFAGRRSLAEPPD
ncbi:MAG TPA: DUF2203 domain-containing protein [Actinomycetota bacterium]|jgi:hypothetical protein|nr:DUF2203 domain-containing protein [Actinomycetota bacterium]